MRDYDDQNIVGWIAAGFLAIFITFILILLSP